MGALREQASKKGRRGRHGDHLAKGGRGRGAVRRDEGQEERSFRVCEYWGGAQKDGGFGLVGREEEGVMSERQGLTGR